MLMNVLRLHPRTQQAVPKNQMRLGAFVPASFAFGTAKTFVTAAGAFVTPKHMRPDFIGLRPACRSVSRCRKMRRS